MLVSIADRLRKIASFIELDDTPLTEEDVMRNKERKDLGEEKRGPGAHRGGVKPGQPEVRKPQMGVVEQKVETTAAPEQKASRKQHEHKKKWNETDRKGLMKDYMQEYRSEGNDQTVKITKPRIKKKKPNT